MFVRKLIILLAMLPCAMPIMAMKTNASGAPEDQPVAKRRETAWDKALEGTPLHNAYNKGDILDFCLALEAGANPNEKKNAHNIIITTQIGKKFTPEEREIAFEALLLKGANIRDAKIRDPQNPQNIILGMSLGHIYTAQDNLAMLQNSLIGGETEEQRIDPNNVDDYGRTPVFYAQQPKAVQILCDAKADITHRDYQGRTVLYGVATNAPVDVAIAASCLRLNPYLRGSRDNNGETAYEAAGNNPNPNLASPEGARELIVGGNNGLFASHRMGNPVRELERRQMGLRNPKTGISNFGIKHIKG